MQPSLKACPIARKSLPLLAATALLLSVMLLISPAASQEDTGLPESEVADPWVNADGSPICSVDILPLVDVEIDDPEDTNDPPRKITVQVRPNRSKLCDVYAIPTGYSSMPPGINKPRDPVPTAVRSVATWDPDFVVQAAVEADPDATPPVEAAPAVLGKWVTTSQTVTDFFAVNKAWEEYNKEALKRDAIRKAWADYVNPNPPEGYVKPAEPPEKPTPWQSCGDTADDCFTYDSQYGDRPDDYGTSGTSAQNTAPTAADTYTISTDSNGDSTVTVTPVTVTRNTDLTEREEANKSCGTCEQAGDKGVAYPAIFTPDNWLENAHDFFEAYDDLDDGGGGSPFYVCEYMYPDDKPEEFICHLHTPGS